VVHGIAKLCPQLVGFELNTGTMFTVIKAVAVLSLIKKARFLEVLKMMQESNTIPTDDY